MEQYIQLMSSLPERTQQHIAESIVVPSANLLLGTVKNRIVRKGLKTDGGSIGNYSAKPGYYSKKQFVKQSAFKGVGKPAPGKKRGKKGNKTMYLEGGYSQLRGIQGMPNSTINANYSGETLLSYQLSDTGKDVALGFTTERSAKIRKYLEKRFGSIYAPSADEMLQFREHIQKRTQTLTFQLLS